MPYFSPSSCLFINVFCLTFFLTCNQNVKLVSHIFWEGPCSWLNRRLVESLRELNLVCLSNYCGKNYAEWRAAEACIPLSSFTDRKWASSVPAFLTQMFNRQNIFTAGGGNGREMICFTIHHHGSDENQRGKPTYMIHIYTYSVH